MKTSHRQIYVNLQEFEIEKQQRMSNPVYRIKFMIYKIMKFLKG
jgi:hypothetical protein